MLRSILTSLAPLILSSSLCAQFVAGDIYVAGCGGTIHRVDPVTYTPTVFTSIECGSGMLFRGTSTMVALEWSTVQVLEIDAAANKITVLDPTDGIGGPFGSNGVLRDSSGLIYTCDYGTSRIMRFQSDYSGGTVFADSSDGVVNPDGTAFLASGDLLVGSRGMGGTILSIDAGGVATLWDTLPSGDDVTSMAVRRNGDVYVVGTKGHLYRYVGGVVGSRQLLASTGPDNYPTLCFNPDHSTLYLGLFNSGTLKTVDPDGGAVTPRTTGLDFPCGIAVVCSDASWSNYDVGFPGTLGIPSLSMSGDPVLGTSVSLDIGNSRGSNTPGVFFLGLAPLSVPGSWGGKLLVLPQLTLILSIPASGLSLPTVLPDDDSLCSLHLYMQVLEIDPGAAKNISNTAGLEAILGR